MLSPRKFEILLDRPDHKFEPGEIVSGRLVVELNAPETIRGIKVLIEGEALVKWSETHTRMENNKTVHYHKYFRSQETYVNIERYVLIGNIGNDEVEIQAGFHVFPFEFRLPLHIPNSFTGLYGGIAYKVKGIVDRPWRLNHYTMKDVVVEASHDLSQLPMIAIHDEQNKTFCCLYFIDMGSMKVNVFLPTSNYAIGETIDVKIKMNNKSTSVNVTAVELRLEQRILFSTSDGIRRDTKIVKKSRHRGSFNKRDEIVVSMEVPRVHCSNATRYCAYINIEYRLHVILKVSGCHMNISRDYPIQIGSKSARSIQSQTPMSTMPMLHNPRVFGAQSPTNTNNEMSQFASGIPSRTYGSILPTISPTAPLLDDWRE